MDQALITQYLDKIVSNYPQQLADQILVYLQLLTKWNKAYNLTAIRSPEQMLTHHILDSLAIASYIEGPRIMDVGTGPGFPGLPLAMLMPQRYFTLLDSNAKKTRFVNQVIMELGIQNAEVATSRVENYEPKQNVNTIVSRAFSSLDEFVQKTSRLCVKKGLLIAMKGRYPTDELKAIDPSLDYEVKQLQVPGLNAERHLVLIRI